MPVSMDLLHAMVKATLESELKTLPKEQIDFISQQLAMQKKTLAQYISETAANPDIQKQVAMQSFLQKNIFKGISVTEAEALKFYNANKQMFETPADPAEAMRASHILIMVEKNAKPEIRAAALAKANAILKELRANPALFEAKAKAEAEAKAKAEEEAAAAAALKAEEEAKDAEKLQLLREIRDSLRK